MGGKKVKNEEVVDLTVIKEKRIYSVKALSSQSIMESLIRNNIKIWAPCNSRGTCGKCKIKITEGKVQRVRNNYELLNTDEIEKGICLACSCYPLEKCTIEILDSHEEEFQILESYSEDNIELNTGIEILSVEVNENNIKFQSLSEYIKYKTKMDLEFSLKSLRKLSTIINESSKNQRQHSLYKERHINLILEKHKIIDICSSNNTEVYGIAVDIGTTTIVLSIVNLLTGKVSGTASSLNSQRQFGADVISRIQYSSEKSIYSLRDAIREDIIQGIEELCIQSKINKMSVQKLVISGNTTMLHLLMGLFSESMSMYPFTTVVNSQINLSFNELFENNTLECQVELLPVISAYIGADITAGMVKCNFHKSEDICMLIDIGTNGEMAIGNKDKVLCAATAAGPAFEGANIENGIGSVSGAIYSVNIENGDILYKTINDKPPVGICGSAVIDIVAEGLKNKLIDNTGKLNKEIVAENYIKISKDGDNEKIIFTQKDIRELQLAKSAICSGIEMLIKNFGCTYEQINKVYIAGGFGNKINLDNAVSIGVIPKQLDDKTCLIGNSSLAGAIKYLLNIETKKQINYIIDNSKYIDLSLDEEFNKLFIKNINFI